MVLIHVVHFRFYAVDEYAAGRFYDCNYLYLDISRKPLVPVMSSYFNTGIRRSNKFLDGSLHATS